MIYLDNAATTRVFPEVAEAMTEVLTTTYGNPSSMHFMGFDAEKKVKQASETISRLLKVDPKEIVFTSGGTESNNMALIGGALGYHRSGKHIITTAIEHASVYNPMFYLEEQGFEVTYLPVDSNGIVKLHKLKEALREDTILVSIMYVNNEVGAVQPIEEIGRIVKEYKKDILFHVDAIQAFGKIPIYPKKMGIDMLSVSGHKIHGPKGIGFLYMKDRLKVKPIILGGGQQKDMRSGTENVPGIVGLAVAADLMNRRHEELLEHMAACKKRLIEGALAIEDVYDNSGEAPHIVSLSFPGVRSEVLLHALEEKGICVSSGSACSSNHPQVSGTLKGMGLTKEKYESTIRFSFSYYTTMEEIETTIEALKELVPVLRRFVRR
jgi:cysteine desulfurase